MMNTVRAAIPVAFFKAASKGLAAPVGVFGNSRDAKTITKMGERYRDLQIKSLKRKYESCGRKKALRRKWTSVGSDQS